MVSLAYIVVIKRMQSSSKTYKIKSLKLLDYKQASCIQNAVYKITERLRALSLVDSCV